MRCGSCICSGGLPPLDLEKHGLQIDEIRLDPPELRTKRTEKALSDRQAVAAAVDHGLRAIRSIQQWCYTRFRRRPSIDRTRACLHEIAALARIEGQGLETIARTVAAKADAYLIAANGKVEAAISAAWQAGDHQVAVFVDFAARSFSDDAEGMPPAPTGPPAGADLAA